MLTQYDLKTLDKLLESEPPHKTVKLRLKTWNTHYREEVEIDRLIVPVVEWLNGLRGVTTYACCEGHDFSSQYSFGKPYVAFTCYSMQSLRTILKALSRKCRMAAKSGIRRYNGVTAITFAVVESEYNIHLDRYQYCVRFCDKQRLREFNRHLRVQAGKLR